MKYKSFNLFVIGEIEVKTMWYYFILVNKVVIKCLKINIGIYMGIREFLCMVGENRN